ncbi:MULTISPECIES: sodium:proton antiporter [unclassified Polaromonas]|uniref:cation:proton antiporter n=1 Tax=unclassified Polaromonas TaxID=2638319 RepID=UPI0018C9C62D|nr:MULTISPECIES: cation:proton antiporter [unclassified Polaromonas]MBG6072231.1 NhaP-type Na+/H+ or K+/H+ antiporter [Polaromonas sp. CG_9.7]MBG6114338.1 NhaP-type Na+/H+ or K+/H+ antiporter [Polaromonas sp. CG_9.2]
MLELDPFALGALIIGLLLVVMTMGSSFLSRLPLNAAMLYLGVGVAVGPMGLDLLRLDALENTVMLERLTEIAVLISLFTAGMKLELPLRDRRWRIPLQLATVSMIVTVVVVAAIGVYGLGLSPGAAILLGAILAPTDPVLASDVQVSNRGDRDRLRFGLTGEGGLNDGTAFPFVMLGLGLLGVHELGEAAWRWWTVDVVWAISGGLGLGYLLGTLVGRAIIYLRMRHREALRSDEFIALGLIALTYGAALLCHTYGFLAVFAAGLALRRIDEGASATSALQAETQKAGFELSPEEQAAAGAEAPTNMMNAVQRFNSQLESFVEVAIVLAVGVLLASVEFESDVLWFVPVLFLMVRPLAVYGGLIGTQVSGSQRNLMSWFGIRGIGSLYYLLYAINHNIQPALAERLLSITLAVVVASIIIHGISVTPLMQHYESRKTIKRQQRKK